MTEVLILHDARRKDWVEISYTVINKLAPMGADLIGLYVMLCQHAGIALTKIGFLEYSLGARNLEFALKQMEEAGLISLDTRGHSWEIKILGDPQ